MTMFGGKSIFFLKAYQQNIDVPTLLTNCFVFVLFSTERTMLMDGRRWLITESVAKQAITLTLDTP
jgi:hypothetical protein